METTARRAGWWRQGGREAVDALLQGLFPARCGACGAVLRGEGRLHGSLCAPCRVSLLPMDASACPRCAQPRPGWGGEQAAPPRCGACRTRPPPWRDAQAGYEYGGALADTIRRFKYGSAPELAAALVELLAEVGSGLPAEAALVLPVPLHPRRLRARGYNQAALLGRLLARDWERPFAVDGLARIRDTLPQALQPTASARRANVAGAFVVRRAALVAGRAVVLVDDVMTTGATVGACARALRHAGARSVYIRVIARG